MNDSMVLFDSSEIVSSSVRNPEDFYSRIRLEVAEIVAALDEKWTSVTNVDPKMDYRHTFRLKSFEDFVAEEMQRRAPQDKAPIAPKPSSNIQQRRTVPSFRPSEKTARRSVRMETLKSNFSSRPPPDAKAQTLTASVTQKRPTKKPVWIRVEDIHIPHN